MIISEFGTKTSKFLSYSYCILGKPTYYSQQNLRFFPSVPRSSSELLVCCSIMHCFTIHQHKESNLTQSFTHMRIEVKGSGYISLSSTNGNMQMRFLHNTEDNAFSLRSLLIISFNHFKAFKPTKYRDISMKTRPYTGCKPSRVLFGRVRSCRISFLQNSFLVKLKDRSSSRVAL